MNVSCEVITSKILGGYFSSYFLFKIIKIKLLQYCSEFWVPSVFTPTYSGKLSYSCSWSGFASGEFTITLPPKKRREKKGLKLRFRSHPPIFQRLINVKCIGMRIMGITRMFFPSKYSAGLLWVFLCCSTLLFLLVCIICYLLNHI